LTLAPTQTVRRPHTSHIYTPAHMHISDHSLPHAPRSVRDVDGLTPLYVACANGHERCAVLLLERGCKTFPVAEGEPALSCVVARALVPLSPLFYSQSRRGAQAHVQRAHTHR
jgi:ankyrin repeat protein